MLPYVHLGEIMTLCFMAFALSVDAFSMSIGLGLKGIRLLNILKISLLIGSFHVVMPLAGTVIGGYLSSYMGSLAVIIGGLLLGIFGLHMIFSTMFGVHEENSWMKDSGWGLLLFSLGVSMDGFSIGLSLGLFAVNTWLSILLFGLFSLVLTALGLLIGRKLGTWVGEYSELIGGVILLAFGIKFLI